ncbi:hypothetical protein [Lentzea sp. NPDC051838]|uniref:hypothetical protein n=1 Tax=Lentzea sp. NPDC051838 TaxID=3154849 RepID=UPI003446F3AC
MRVPGGRRAVAGLGAGAVLVALLVALPDRAEDLGDRLRRFIGTVREDNPYQPPSEHDRRRFAAALVGLNFDDLRSLGMVVNRGTDARTGRPYALVTEAPGAERGWGLYAVDLSQPVRVAVQVPHPVNDLRTDEIGLELFRRAPGAVLAVAGTHRRAAGGDMAHRTDSMFHALAEEQARLRLPQVQLHGFDDRSLPSSDVVLSSGAAVAGDQIARAADVPGLRVCRAWRSDCGALEGTRNAQGATAAQFATTFFHVEINRSVRDDPAKWTGLVEAIAKTI